MAYLNKSDHFLPVSSARMPSGLPARAQPVRAGKAVAVPQRRALPQNLWLYLGFAALLIAAYIRLDHYFEEPAMTFLVVTMGALPVWAVIAPRTPATRR